MDIGRDRRLTYFVHCKDCNDFTKWDSIEAARNQRFKHYWKQHDNTDNIIITEYLEIRTVNLFD